MPKSGLCLECGNITELNNSLQTVKQLSEKESEIVFGQATETPAAEIPVKESVADENDAQGAVISEDIDDIVESLEDQPGIEVTENESTLNIEISQIEMPLFEEQQEVFVVEEPEEDVQTAVLPENVDCIADLVEGQVDIEPTLDEGSAQLDTLLSENAANASDVIEAQQEISAGSVVDESVVDVGDIQAAVMTENPDDLVDSVEDQLDIETQESKLALELEATQADAPLSENAVIALDAIEGQQETSAVNESSDIHVEAIPENVVNRLEPDRVAIAIDRLMDALYTKNVVRPPDPSIDRAEGNAPSAENDAVTVDYMEEQQDISVAETSVNESVVDDDQAVINIISESPLEDGQDIEIPVNESAPDAGSVQVEAQPPAVEEQQETSVAEMTVNEFVVDDDQITINIIPESPLEDGQDTETPVNTPAPDTDGVQVEAQLPELDAIEEQQKTSVVEKSVNDPVVAVEDIQETVSSENIGNSLDSKHINTAIHRILKMPTTKSIGNTSYSVENKQMQDIETPVNQPSDVDRTQEEAALLESHHQKEASVEKSFVNESAVDNAQASARPEHVSNTSDFVEDRQVLDITASAKESIFKDSSALNRKENYISKLLIGIKGLELCYGSIEKPGLFVMTVPSFSFVKSISVQTILHNPYVKTALISFEERNDLFNVNPEINKKLFDIYEMGNLLLNFVYIKESKKLFNKIQQDMEKKEFASVDLVLIDIEQDIFISIVDDRELAAILSSWQRWFTHHNKTCVWIVHGDMAPGFVRDKFLNLNNMFNGLASIKFDVADIKYEVVFWHLYSSTQSNILLDVLFDDVNHEISVSENTELTKKKA